MTEIIAAINEEGSFAATSSVDLDLPVYANTHLFVTAGGVSDNPAAGKLVLPGANNDFSLTALNSGAAYNNLTVNFMDVGAAAEFVYHDGVTNVLTIGFRNNVRTAAEVIALINTPAKWTSGPQLFSAASTEPADTGIVSAFGLLVSNVTSGGTGPGLKAGGTVVLSGVDNDLRFEANLIGAEYNFLTVVFEDVAGTHAYDPATKTLTLRFLSGSKTASQLVGEIALIPGIQYTAMAVEGSGGGAINMTSGDLTDVSSGGMAPGAPAVGTIIFAGPDNDILLTALESGVLGNNLTVELVSVAAGQEAAIYDPILHSLTLLIANGSTTAADLITLIDAPEIPFDAARVRPDPTDLRRLPKISIPRQRVEARMSRLVLSAPLPPASWSSQVRIMT